MPTTKQGAAKSEWLPAQRAVANANSPFAAELFLQLNQARVDPLRYATELEKDDDLDFSFGLGKLKFDLQFRRDRAVRAADTLRSLAHADGYDDAGVGPYRPPLESICAGMTKACLDHIMDVRKVDISVASERDPHMGKDRSTPHDRAERYGDCRGRCDEVIVFKASPQREADGTPGAGDAVREARSVMRQLIESQSHRAMIFDPDFRDVGIACGPHAFLGTTVCIVLCDDYDPNPYAPYVPQKVKTRIFGNGWFVCLVTPEPIDLKVTLPVCSLM